MSALSKAPAETGFRPVALPMPSEPNFDASNGNLVANPQGSVEWLHERLGKVTASRVADVVAKTKAGWATSRQAYMNELLAERLTGLGGDGYVSSAMQWGLDHEAEARRAYRFLRNQDVTLAGFVPHPSMPMTGASPDGYCGSDGLVEFKCPNTTTHLNCWLDGAIPDRHLLQMTWQLACTGRSWCDYVSYDPRLPPTLRMFVRRVESDPDRVADLEMAVAEFIDDLDQLTTFLTDQAPGKPAS